MARIAYIDFDDTLFFTEKAIEKAALEFLGKRLKKEEVRKLPKHVKSKIYHLAFKKYKKLSVVNHKLRILLGKLKNRGYKIIILTARSNDVLEDTIYLLNKYSIPYDDLIARSDLNMKDEEWKARIIKNTDAEEILLFEDKLENIEYIKQTVSDKKLKIFLVTKHYIFKLVF